MSFAMVKRQPNGQLVLPAGRYFIDTSEDKWEAALHEIAQVFPSESLGEVHTGHGFAMASFDLKAPIVVPQSIWKLTNAFFVLPGSRTLNDISQELYGDTFSSPRGLLEYLSTEYPAIFDTMKSAAEGIAETKDAIDKSISSTGKALMWVGAALVLIVLVSRGSGRSAQD